MAGWLACGARLASCVELRPRAAAPVLAQRRPKPAVQEHRASPRWQTVAIALALLIPGTQVRAQTPSYANLILPAVGQWLSTQRPDGFLPYGYDFLANEAREPDTLSAANLTRQAATAAALADYFALTKDPRARPAIQRFLRAFGRHALPIGKSRGQVLLEATRILSLPVGRYKLRAALARLGLLYETKGPGAIPAPGADYGKAYAGAAALALLTELRYTQASRDNQFAPLRQAWLQGLIALRIPGDGFRQFPTSIDTNAYMDGQGWLALAQYHHSFPNDHGVTALLADLDMALMRKYGTAFRAEFYHWGTMAAAARYADTRDPRLLAFIEQQTRTFLSRVAGRPSADNTCASVEGVADALGALQRAGEGDSALARQAMEWVGIEMRKNTALQIQPGQRELVFGDARIIAPGMSAYAGAFRSGIYAADTQIDLTAHCVSAMVKLRRNGLVPRRTDGVR